MFFRNRIRDFHLEKTGVEPNWQNLRIVNAWGAPGDEEHDGIYYEFCRENRVDYLTLDAARTRFGSENALDKACAEALAKTQDIQQRYHSVLVDEAQDLPPSFLRLCYSSLKDPKRLVYAYDELQNLNGASLPPPEEIFGDRQNGRPLVSCGVDDQNQLGRDLILRKCYRNPRPVLIAAHAVGFGIYRVPPTNDDIGLVQMFDQQELWEAMGYEVRDGGLEEGKEVTLIRTNATSPELLEKHSAIDDLIMFKGLGDEVQQAKWVANSIASNLDDDELQHTDIVVINLNPHATRQSMGPLRANLLDRKINSHVVDVNTRPVDFERDDSPSIAFAGIHRAKGIEAAMVYIINAHSGLDSARELASVRNRLFTAITRSTAWVRVTGIGSCMTELENEFKALRERDFALQFCYPTAEERKELRAIHGDASEEEEREARATSQKLVEIIRDIEQGKISPKCLDPDLVQQLNRVLSTESR